MSKRVGRTSRRAVLRLGIGAAAMLAAGCGPQETTSSGSSSTPGTGGDAGGKKLRIGMSQANKGEPWRQAMNDQIAAAAKEHPNLEVVFADAAQNNAKQVADVENFLQQGIDLLIISPNEAAPLTDVVAKAHEKIPVIVLDRKVNGDAYTMWIGADNKKIGARAGEYAAKWCTDNGRDPGRIIEIRGLEGSTPCKERGDGFRDGLRAAGTKAKVIATQNGDWLREKAVSVSQALLQANPDVDVIYAHNDPMAEAAIISAESAGKDLSKILVIGIDALATPDGGIKSVMDGRIDVTYVYPTGGREAIEWAVKILQDKETAPREVVLETEEVTSANATEIYAKYGGK